MLAVCMAAFAPARAESGDAAPAVQMHRAVYDLSLDRVKNVSDIEGLQGRMVVEWRGGSACGGYISDQRVVILSSDAQGNSSTNDVRLSSWESLDGGEFRFERTEYANGEPPRAKAGRSGAAWKASFWKWRARSRKGFLPPCFSRPPSIWG